MSREMPVEALPPETQIGRAGQSQPLPRRNLSGNRLALALALAAFADVLSIFLTFAPPVQWGADLLTAAKNGWKNSGVPWTYQPNPERMRVSRPQ